MAVCKHKFAIIVLLCVLSAAAHPCSAANEAHVAVAADSVSQFSAEPDAVAVPDTTPVVPTPVVPASNSGAVVATGSRKNTNNMVTVTMFWQDGVWFSGWFRSLGRAAQVASQIPHMSTLLAAVTAAGVGSPLKSTKTVWTILAPTNQAFENLLEDLGVSAADLLADKALLVKVLSYHVIPSAAATSAQLMDGKSYPTALDGATVTIDKRPSGSVRIIGAGNEDKVATVIAANIRAGKSIIHVIDEVLLP